MSLARLVMPSDRQRLQRGPPSRVGIGRAEDPPRIFSPLPQLFCRAASDKPGTISTSAAYDRSSVMADNTVSSLRDILTSESIPLARRFRALFSLKHLASQHPPTTQTVPAIEAIADALPTPSELLKHELAYCLGQCGQPEAIPILRRALEDPHEAEICRHEAAEALGALGDEDSLALLKKYRDAEDAPTTVRETCEIAVARIEWQYAQSGREKVKTSDFASIDPAPPFPLGEQPASIPELQRSMMDQKLSLFDRYRAMFSLRDLASPPDLPTAVPAVEALATGFDDPSALFRHEIAFVFGQLSHPASIPSLIRTLRNTSEMGMVRHEAAEALGSLGEEDGIEDILKQFVDDEERVVSESCVVALDMAEYERSGQAEYAILPESSAVAAAA